MMRSIDKTLAVCILARNCEKSLPSFLEKIEKLRSCYKDSRVFIVENNSTDGTRALITRYRDAFPGVITDCFDNFLLDKIDRIEKMAILRNRYIELVASEPDFTPEHLVVIDSDTDFREDNIIDIIQNAPCDWVSLSANGRYYISVFGKKLHVLYYDLYALVPESCREYMLSQGQMFANRTVVQRALRKREYVKCRSAFGGIAIYRYDALCGKRYTLEKNTKTDDFRYVCEHIPLTLELSASGSNYICRDLRVSYERISFKAFIKALLIQFRSRKYNKYKEAH